MICVKCDSEFPCSCPDAEERVTELANMDGGIVVFRWCVNCDRHYAFCECEHPEWMARCGGRTSSLDDWRDLTGQPVSDREFTP